MLNLTNQHPNYTKYKIGKWTYGLPRVEDWKQADITLTIGNFCSIARGVTIWLGGNHHGEWITTSPLNDLLNVEKIPKFFQVSSKGSVFIGNDVWIGTEVDILSGITIGDGAIIGCRTVVSKNIPPYSVVVGNPAIIKKKRFNDVQIRELLKIKWWDWTDEKIKENIPLLLNNDIDAFILKHQIKT